MASYSESAHVVHPIPPLYRADSRILILGSFPSVKSRETAFFYGHGQNRFWRVLSALFASPLPKTVEEKRTLLYAHGIALWDVLAACEIRGSSDASIRGAVPTDLTPIFETAHISAVFVNGSTAARYYHRFHETRYGKATVLPSTSAANASWSLPALVSAWSVILPYLGEADTVFSARY